MTHPQRKFVVALLFAVLYGGVGILCWSIPYVRELGPLLAIVWLIVVRRLLGWMVVALGWAPVEAGEGQGR
ncbi:hypothetical protein [Stenotrophomonas tumulicola]|uniref:Transmembrane protein n=1 Tax=Stenotrophomonas tumulicola TaxID=1685415 RepID=A0A7W3FN65_9GAMM|nr:hypothetical protein [Stenotrophomonas tumulicola]MBA8682321.1 hypothetical protein [Stenotrophomonas tumulicola]